MAVRCRTLIAGFGIPTQRDLDFGRQVIRFFEQFTWPDGVAVEELCLAAPLVLHRLHELQPSRLVLVGAIARGVDAPGTVRRRSIDPAASASAANGHDHLADSVAGDGDLDRTLAVLRQWGGLPPDTVVIEVEPNDCAFGTGFSEELAPCFDTILGLVWQELGGEPGRSEDGPALAVAPSDFEVEAGVADGGGDCGGAPPATEAPVPGYALSQLMDYARARKEARLEERHRGGDGLSRLPADAGVEIVGRARPWAIGLDGGSDWYDVIPLDDGAIAVVLGDVPGRGVAATALKCDLRVAVQAYAVLEGRSPAQVVTCLDRMAASTGRGEMTTLAYLTLQPETGEIRLCTAGQCPPLLLTDSGGRFLHDTLTAPVGAIGASRRQEITARLEPDATLLLFTDGLVRGPTRPLARGLAALVDAAVSGPSSLDALCDHVVGACSNRERRDDDLSLLALRRAAPARQPL